MSVNEKQPPPIVELPTYSNPRPPQPASPWICRSIFRAILVVGFVYFVILSTLFKISWRTLVNPGHCHSAGRFTYAGEHISWERCGELANGRPLECSTIDVPMDQFDQENSGDKTFSIPLVRLRGKNATQNLLLNPGGPGGSGTEFIYRKGEQLNSIVGEGFHLLGFDPRGVNESRPLASCYPDGETRRKLSSVRDSNPLEDGPEIFAWTTNFVRACADIMGEHGKYVNTPQTAADMNSILDAVGQNDMVYWGFSYGTLLGQTYAALFPERSKRVIIDGVVNQNDWYTGLDDFESLEDTEKVLDGFFDECIKAGKNCTLSSHADSKEGLKDKILSLVNDLKDQPLSVYVNASVYGTLDYQKILHEAIFTALYKPLGWYDLADRLAGILEGNATEALLAYGLENTSWNQTGEAYNFVLLNDGLTGPEHWPEDREALLDMFTPFFNSTLFGAVQIHTYFEKQQWTIPSTHKYVPKNGVSTAHPLLILSTTYDPVCRKSYPFRSNLLLSLAISDPSN